MQQLKTLAASVCLAAAMTSACGSAVHGEVPAAPAPGEQRIAAIFQRVNGSADDAAASDFVSHVTVQSSLQRCFAKRGVEYRPEPWHRPLTATDAQRQQMYPSDVLALLRIDEAYVTANGLGRGEPLAVSVARDHAAVPDASGTGFGVAPGTQVPSAMGAECRAMATTGAGARYLPGLVAEQTSADLARMLAGVEDDPRVRGELERAIRCVADAGFGHVDSGNDLWLVFQSRFEDAVPSAAKPSVDSEVWTRLASEEMKAARTLAACLAAAHSVAVEVAEDAIEQFEADHASQLDVVDAAWQDRRDVAARCASDPTWFDAG